ncbi:hypothetical protein BDV24DRAFT_129664 [Aspergillus arachidicola]|uniref:Uncharacterized protein n=1 Tax=Aspergillus arachidicola TaxID=656916 RepID=A0A5N6YD08_9EURO|nr:hypothetical protein BDV24DRAFT_129664 [Aspergillus arachidicola]
MPGIKGTRYPAIRYERADNKALALPSSYFSARPSASPVFKQDQYRKLMLKDA